MLNKFLVSLLVVTGVSANAESWNSLYKYPGYIENSYALELDNNIVGTRFEQYWDHGPMTFTVIYFNCKNKTQRLVGRAHFYDSGELDFKHKPEGAHYTPADTGSRDFAFACRSGWSDFKLAP
jgi:hypothetical protein